MAQYPFIFISDSLTLPAGGSSDLKLEFPTGFAVTLHRLLVNSTGRFRIDRVVDKAGNSYLSRVLDSGQLAQVARDPLPPGITVAAGEILVFTLTDLSGASNLIFLGFLGLRA